jgi:2-polyprenyl-3-methyl-5-hydroxy-6-metoxy-1,4-benzoquinol methylase
MNLDAQSLESASPDPIPNGSGATPSKASAEKHHYRAHYGPRSSHQQIAKIVLQTQAAPALDVGAAQGIIGELLQDSGMEIDGVEPNAAWAEAAKPYYHQVFACPIEEADLPLNHYRTIILGDVLEHTMEPVHVLQQLRKHAAADATYIISVPNVAHVAVRALLFFGRFPRMERGILDRTHRHFFTRDTAEAVLKDAGLRLVKRSATPVPLDGLFKHQYMKPVVEAATRAQYAAVNLLPRWFAMQWIFVAQHSEAQ